MDLFSRTKAVAWTIAILVILNLCTLGTVWYQQLDGHRREPHPRHQKGDRRVSRFLRRELGFSEGQEKRVTKLQKKFFASAHGIQREVNKLRGEMMECLVGGKPDAAGADELASKIGEREAQKERLLFAHFEEIKSVCDAAQKEKFDSLVGKLSRMMGPPEHKGPRKRRGRRGLPGRTGPQGRKGPYGKPRPQGPGMHGEEMPPRGPEAGDEEETRERRM